MVRHVRGAPLAIQEGMEVCVRHFFKYYSTINSLHNWWIDSMLHVYQPCNGPKSDLDIELGNAETLNKLHATCVNTTSLIITNIVKIVKIVE